MYLVINVVTTSLNLHFYLSCILRNGILIFNYRISDLQFNVTPPPTVTTSAPDDVCTSELSLVIDKADSIEDRESEKDESGHGGIQHMKTLSCDELVIEEETPVTPGLSGSVEAKERKISVVAMERKSFEVDDSRKQLSKPIEASFLPPTSTSTQTVPTAEFPEASAIATSANQPDDDDAKALAQLNVETQQDIRTAKEIDTKANEARKLCSRSISERAGGSSTDNVDEATTSRVVTSKSCDEQHQKQRLLSHQQSISQDDDFEVAMVSGLLPGCVAPAPTPAPSIAPLAEIEADPTEEEIESAEQAAEQADIVEPKPEVERKKKRKERKEKEGSDSQNQPEADSSTDPEKSKRNAVCPWEDE